MISLKKYLDAALTGAAAQSEPEEESILPAVLSAFGSSLAAMGSCSVDACPAHGEQLKESLGKLKAKLSPGMSRTAVEATERAVQERLQAWGERTAGYYEQRAREVKEMLLVMARTAESVGQRDQSCAVQINDVTARLKKIASLDDLSMIRSSIEKSAAELKTSIEKMTAEGKAAIAELRVEVSRYQTKLEQAEQVASTDTLTGLRSRLCVENRIDYKISCRTPLCIAIIDINDFKQVNDDYGHLAGDEILKQFAAEIKSVCRATDVIGRWGGDEFIILLECRLHDAKAQIDRILDWVCGDYKVTGRSGQKKLHVDASVGLAEYMPFETMKELLSRADAAMYRHKAASRTKMNGTRR